MKALFRYISLLLPVVLCLMSVRSLAQNDASVHAKIDATQITVGDQARLFIEATHNAKQSQFIWAILPDSFNKLEIVEKGKIDTTRQGDLVTYKQRLLITGFDSGTFTIPSFVFTTVPNGGSPATLHTDSFTLTVQTVAVDTTKPFKGIKGIVLVKSTWLDYLLYIIGAIIFIVLLVVVISYFMKNKKVPAPIVDPTPKETLQEKTLRLLNELEQQQLWQRGQVKEYYIQLSDIVRNYIELRFRTPALELTTDEILETVRKHKEMLKHSELLGNILYTADLAKFAKAQPLPQEHVDTMEQAKQFVAATRPVITETPPQS